MSNTQNSPIIDKRFNSVRIARGLVAATYTPMNPDGSIAFRRIPEQIDFLLQRGVDGIFACGSTGEGLSLSCDERERMTEAVVAAVAGKVPVLSHIGHNSIVDARRLAVHAEACGVDAVAAIASSFFYPKDAEALVDYFSRMAEGAPSTPFYYYHFPTRIPTGILLEDILERALEKIPTFCGVKYTHSDLEELSRCNRQYAGRLNFYFGRDEHFIAALRAGFYDFVGSTYNYATIIFCKLRAAFDRGDIDEAERLQRLVDRLIDLINSLPPFSGQKYLMQLSGFDCGGPRSPLTAISEQEQERASAEWAAIMKEV